MKEESSEHEQLGAYEQRNTLGAGEENNNGVNNVNLKKIGKRALSFFNKIGHSIISPKTVSTAKPDIDNHYEDYVRWKYDVVYWDTKLRELSIYFPDHRSLNEDVQRQKNIYIKQYGKFSSEVYKNLAKDFSEDTISSGDDDLKKIFKLFWVDREEFDTEIQKLKEKFEQNNVGHKLTKTVSKFFKSLGKTNHNNQDLQPNNNQNDEINGENSEELVEDNDNISKSSN